MQGSRRTSRDATPMEEETAVPMDTEESASVEPMEEVCSTQRRKYRD